MPDAITLKVSPGTENPEPEYEDWDENGPKWDAVPIPDEAPAGPAVETFPASAPSELPPEQALFVEGGQWRLESLDGKTLWEAEATELTPDDRARIYILVGVFSVLSVLLLSHVILGFKHITAVDDVVKLLGPLMSITATILGAAVAFYFAQRK